MVAGFVAAVMVGGGFDDAHSSGQSGAPALLCHVSRTRWNSGNRYLAVKAARVIEIVQAHQPLSLSAVGLRQSAVLVPLRYEDASEQTFEVF